MGNLMSSILDKILENYTTWSTLLFALSAILGVLAYIILHRGSAKSALVSHKETVEIITATSKAAIDKTLEGIQIGNDTVINNIKTEAIQVIDDITAKTKAELKQIEKDAKNLAISKEYNEVVLDLSIYFSSDGKYSNVGIFRSPEEYYDAFRFLLTKNKSFQLSLEQNDITANYLSENDDFPILFGRMYDATYANCISHSEQSAFVSPHSLKIKYHLNAVRLKGNLDELSKDTKFNFIIYRSIKDGVWKKPPLSPTGIGYQRLHFGNLSKDRNPSIEVQGKIIFKNGRSFLIKEFITNQEEALSGYLDGMNFEFTCKELFKIQ